MNCGSSTCSKCYMSERNTHTVYYGYREGGRLFFVSCYSLIKLSYYAITLQAYDTVKSAKIGNPRVRT
jgi:hypothetical protein